MPSDSWSRIHIVRRGQIVRLITSRTTVYSKCKGISIACISHLCLHSTLHIIFTVATAQSLIQPLLSPVLTRSHQQSINMQFVITLIALAAACASAQPVTGYEPTSEPASSGQTIVCQQNQVSACCNKKSAEPLLGLDCTPISVAIVGKICRRQ